MHWWYYPDSYDSWIPLKDVSGAVDAPETPPAVWRVSCRFIEDAAQFNEWGNEEDYEVQDDAVVGDTHSSNQTGGGGGGGDAVTASAAAAAGQQQLTGRKRARDESGPACRLVLVSTAFDKPVEISMPHSLRVELGRTCARLPMDAPAPVGAEPLVDTSLAASLIHVRACVGVAIGPFPCCCPLCLSLLLCRAWLLRCRRSGGAVCTPVWFWLVLLLLFVLVTITAPL